MLKNQVRVGLQPLFAQLNASATESSSFVDTNIVYLVNNAENRLQKSQDFKFDLLRDDYKNLVAKFDSNKKDMDAMNTKIDNLDQLKYLLLFFLGFMTITMPQFASLISLLAKFFKL